MIGNRIFKHVMSVFCSLKCLFYLVSKVTDGGKASKNVQFKELPNVLILQLNRFAYNSATNSTCKVIQYR